jgi:hypothetical protein
MGFFVKNRQIKSGSKSTVLPAGDTVHRPLSPVPGQLRYNTELCKLEYFTGTGYRIVAAEGKTSITVDEYVGDGLAVSFGPMSVPVGNPGEILVFVGSVYQSPYSSYTVTNNTIVFSSPIPDGITVNIVHNLGSTATAGC